MSARHPLCKPRNAAARPLPGSPSAVACWPVGLTTSGCAPAPRQAVAAPVAADRPLPKPPRAPLRQCIQHHRHLPGSLRIHRWLQLLACLPDKISADENSASGSARSVQETTPPAQEGMPRRSTHPLRGARPPHSTDRTGHPRVEGGSGPSARGKHPGNSARKTHPAPKGHNPRPPHRKGRACHIECRALRAA